MAAFARSSPAEADRAAASVMPPSSPLPLASEKLDLLRAELADLAFALERRGRLDAADVVGAVAGRVAELRDELDASVRASTADAVAVAARA
jgi:hypothetical protein